LFLAACLITGFTFSVNAQSVGINATGATPNYSAILDVSSTTKGFLPPRMTTAQIEAIEGPADGLTVYNTTDKKLYVFNATALVWKEISFGAGTISPPPFVCGQPITDARDSKVYNTVLIGTQCWMAQNLNVGTRINGNQAQTNNSDMEKYCYDDLDENCATYGGLYQWDEMMQYSLVEGSQGICPTGLHLPTDAEWATLTTYLGGEIVAGGAMKETGTTHWLAPNTDATNSSGFTCLPGGNRQPDGTLNYLGSYGLLWSSTESSTSIAWFRYLYSNDASLNRLNYTKDYGFSVRCLRD